VKRGGKAVLEKVKGLRPGAYQETVQGIRELGTRVQKTLEAYAPGTRLTAAQRLGTRLPRMLEAYAEGSFFPSTAYLELRGGQDVAMQRVVRDYVGTVSQQMGDEGLGQLLLDALQGSRQTILGATRAAFRKIDDLATGIQVDTSSFVNAIQNAMKRKAGGKVGQAPVLEVLQAAGIPREQFELLARTRRGAVETVNAARFSDVLKLREQLEAVAERTPATLQETRLVETANDLVRTLDDAIDASARRLPQSAQLEYQAIQGLGKGGRWGLDNKTIREVVTLLRDRPEKYADLLLQPKNSTALQRVKAAVSPEDWENVQAGLSQEFLKRATNPSSQLLVGTDLMKQLHALGPETVNAAFGTRAAGLRQLAEAMEYVQRELPLSGAERVLVRIGQGSALSALSGPLLGFSWGQSAGTGLVLTIAPTIIGRMLASPRYMNLMVRGIRSAVPAAKGAARDPQARAALWQSTFGQIAAHLLEEQARERATPSMSPPPTGQAPGLSLWGRPTQPTPPPSAGQRAGTRARQDAMVKMDKSLKAMEAYKQAVEQYRAGTQPAPAPLPVPPLPNLQQTPLVPGPAFP
jgi:hypothetical protein